MFSIVLDTKQVRFILIGNGPLIAKRRDQLIESGTMHVKTFSSVPSEEELKQAHIVYVADLPESEAEEIAKTCRDLGILVNVEDVINLCDFHTPSMIKRGDLLLSISTGGKSPGLAKRLCKHLGHEFGSEWGERLETLAQKRLAWRGEGLSLKQVAANTDEYIKNEKWLG
ncbi:MAG: hypothetical protein DHS20C02_10780 [Micavibrio sp.]|nr:MAG: hypothetical protein DHS20C02_10780 [Micavibrio sp.]